ncbi:MAG: DNA polymerase-3 subunit delta' [Sulfurimonas sp.]|jgi:DNA polymerase-3 subunit delta'|uniref:DNA polymerase III subunit delta' n=1 Tax=Sulfurimonas sp. TaxID=2022749 RepID=UPI0039E51C18
MSSHESNKSHIIISSDIESCHERIKTQLYPSRIVSFIEDGEFKLENAKAVIAESYISESQVKYIVLGAHSYNVISQNALLKVLEEPPKNIEFIIISPTKSNLLPTVRSRLPIIKGDVSHKVKEIDINLLRIDYAQVFAFLKEHTRTSKAEAKLLVEALYHRAIAIDKLLLSEQQLENFDKAYRLLELNSKPQNVLSLLLMSFVGEK